MIGKAIREGAEKRGGHRFAVLEGGYHPDLKWCIKSLLKGLNEASTSQCGFTSMLIATLLALM